MMNLCNYIHIISYGMSSVIDEALFFHISVGSFVENVALIIFEFFIDIGSKLGLLGLSHQFLVQGKCITDGRHIFEVDRIRYF